MFLKNLKFRQNVNDPVKNSGQKGGDGDRLATFQRKEKKVLRNLNKVAK